VIGGQLREIEDEGAVGVEGGCSAWRDHLPSFERGAAAAVE
jgi:hypothetical protein